MQSDPIVELVIDELAAGGDGVGRAPDGRVVFVPFTAPGDRVRVRLVEQHARFARGRVETLVRPGPARTDPVCAVYGSCGGCAWQHIDYQAQLDAKRAIVAAALRRIGGLSHPPVAITPSASAYRYRTRSRVLVSGGRVGYRRRRSHVVCATERCPLLVDELDARLAELAAGSVADGEWELAFGYPESPGPRSRVVRLGREATGDAADPDRLLLPVGADRIGFSETVFVQSNAALIEPMAAAVHEAAGGGKLAFDLFAGAGFLTLGLARRFESVVAVEANPAAVRDLTWNLARAGLHDVVAIGGSVESAIADGRFEGLRPEVIVMDPPRTGLPEGVADALAEIGPQRFVYLSCDPATLSRDLSVLAFSGYEPKSVQLFDLFPQTPHVEVLAVAERG